MNAVDHTRPMAPCCSASCCCLDCGTLATVCVLQVAPKKPINCRAKPLVSTKPSSALPLPRWLMLFHIVSLLLVACAGAALQGSHQPQSLCQQPLHPCQTHHSTAALSCTSLRLATSHADRHCLAGSAFNSMSPPPITHIHTSCTHVQRHLHSDKSWFWAH